jgi:hypothetical protein
MSQSMNEPTTAQSAAATAKILTLGADIDLSAPSVRDDALTMLEGGGIVLLPRAGFTLSAPETGWSASFA